jgi:hypothetical protein
MKMTKNTVSTNLTQEQVDFLENNIDLYQNPDGLLSISNVNTDIIGNINGDVSGNIDGEVKGDIHGDVTGTIHGKRIGKTLRRNRLDVPPLDLLEFNYNFPNEWNSPEFPLPYATELSFERMAEQRAINQETSYHASKRTWRKHLRNT